MEPMTLMQQIRKKLADALWPGYGKRIDHLEGRLKTTHDRMQALYWDGKEKEQSLARIAGLEEALADLSDLARNKRDRKRKAEILERAGIWK